MTKTSVELKLEEKKGK